MGRRERERERTIYPCFKLEIAEERREKKKGQKERGRERRRDRRAGKRNEREKGLPKLRRKLLTVGPLLRLREFGALSQHDTRYDVLLDEDAVRRCIQNFYDPYIALGMTRGSFGHLINQF